MIIGSGLVASAFLDSSASFEDVCIFAAGVSNSKTTDFREFERERSRFMEVTRNLDSNKLLVYFSTCSVYDPTSVNSPYTQHKLRMEQQVSTHAKYIIFRLPQVAGLSPNPHTLLNYLYARIVRSERFIVWRNAMRNIIDIEHVSKLAKVFIDKSKNGGEIINLANANNYSMMDIVREMERVVGKKAIYDVENKGAEFFVDTSKTNSMLIDLKINFEDDYLYLTLSKYYNNKIWYGG